MSAPQINSAQLSLLWQLAARARAASSEQTLAFTILNETLALLPYRQAAWWRCPTPGAVAAVSGLPQSDPTAPYVQWLGSLCRALAHAHSKLASDQAALCTLTARDIPADVAAEWEVWLPAHALWIPIRNRAEVALGGLMFAREEDWKPLDLVLLTELAQIWAHAFAAFNPRPSWTVSARSLLRPGRRQRQALGVLAVVCAVPVRLSVLAPAEVTAKDPFVVRAPLDGVVDRLYVQPNQAVSAREAVVRLVERR